MQSVAVVPLNLVICTACYWPQIRDGFKIDEKCFKKNLNNNWSTLLTSLHANFNRFCEWKTYLAPLITIPSINLFRIKFIGTKSLRCEITLWIYSFRFQYVLLLVRRRVAFGQSQAVLWFWMSKYATFYTFDDELKMEMVLLLVKLFHFYCGPAFYVLLSNKKIIISLY